MLPGIEAVSKLSMSCAGGLHEGINLPRDIAVRNCSGCLIFISLQFEVATKFWLDNSWLVLGFLWFVGWFGFVWFFFPRMAGRYILLLPTL